MVYDGLAFAANIGKEVDFVRAGHEPHLGEIHGGVFGIDSQFHP